MVTDYILKYVEPQFASIHPKIIIERCLSNHQMGIIQTIIRIIVSMGDQKLLDPILNVLQQKNNRVDLKVIFFTGFMFK